ncbi:MAG: protein kinase, partial [Planctomycetota bacterium]
ETLLSEPPPYLLLPLDSGATNENAFPFYRTYPSFSQNLETFLDTSSQHPPLSLEQKITLAKILTKTLIFAHQRGVLHGNLHPRQIFLNEKQEPFLWDFALPAKDWGNLDSTSDQLDDLPYCLDPEQANGNPLIPAGDVYSLGAVFYYLLSGRYPFSQDNPLELLHCHLYETPKSLEQQEGPFLFRELIFQLMDKDPKTRPSLPEVLSRLEKIPQDEIPFVSQTSEKADWRIKFLGLILGVTLFLALPQVRLLLTKGTLDSLYQTRGKRVKLILRNGDTMIGTLIETTSETVPGRIYFRQEEGATYQFFHDEIQTILDFSDSK